MTRISYKRARFPATAIQDAVWLYFRFTLSFRDVEEMLAHRGIDVSYATVRAWIVKFGPWIADNLRRRKLPPSPHWYLDEMVSTIAGERVWILRAVDDEGEVMGDVQPGSLGQDDWQQLADPAGSPQFGLRPIRGP